MKFLINMGNLMIMCLDEFKGLDRLLARSHIVNNLKKSGNLEKIEKIIHSVPYGDRSGTVIEPYLTEQWFLDVNL